MLRQGNCFGSRIGTAVPIVTDISRGRIRMTLFEAIYLVAIAWGMAAIVFAMYHDFIEK